MSKETFDKLLIFLVLSPIFLLNIYLIYKCVLGYGRKISASWISLGLYSGRAFQRTKKGTKGWEWVTPNKATLDERLALWFSTLLVLVPTVVLLVVIFKYGPFK